MRLHLYIGALAKSTLNSSSFDYSERDEGRRELDEVLLSTLRWSGIPVAPGGTTLVADDRSGPVATDQDVASTTMPTPEIEGEQDGLNDLLVTQSPLIRQYLTIQ